MMEIVDDLLAPARQCPSPNCDDRPDGEISLIVIHGISLPAGHFGNPYVERLFCNTLDASEHPDFADVAEMKVSSHLFIRRDGNLVQFVPFSKRAWHAGASNFEGREQCNDFSVGIELEGTDGNGYRDVQYLALAEVCSLLVDHYSIAPGNIAGHSDIAPGRKTDPGPGFDWDRLREAMVGVRRP